MKHQLWRWKTWCVSQTLSTTTHIIRSVCSSNSLNNAFSVLARSENVTRGPWNCNKTTKQLFRKNPEYRAKLKVLWLREKLTIAIKFTQAFVIYTPYEICSRVKIVCEKPLRITKTCVWNSILEIAKKKRRSRKHKILNCLNKRAIWKQIKIKTNILLSSMICSHWALWHLRGSLWTEAPLLYTSSHKEDECA